MLFPPKFNPTSEWSDQINIRSTFAWSSSEQAKFFQSSVVQIWWVCVKCSLTFMFLANSLEAVSLAALCLFFCCCWPPSLWFNVLCLQRWCSAFLDCTEWLFQLLLPFFHLEPVCPVSSDLSHQQGIFLHTTASLVSLFWTSLYKL